MVIRKVLYIHQYFKTPQEPGGTRSYWFATELVKNDFSVTMITSKSVQDKAIESKIIDGIKVIYIRNHYSNEMGIVARFLSFFRFMIKSTLIGFKEKEVNLVMATSTPLTVGVPALILKWIKRIPYVFEVRDLWPEVPIQMGVLRNSIIRYLAVKLERMIYKNAAHIIALSPGMKEGILKYKISANKVSMIPNMSKIDWFYPRKRDEKLKKKIGVKKDCFYVIHFGAMGIANGLDYIIDAAKILQNNFQNTINFIFAGKGQEEEKLKQRCKDENLNNVFFLGTFAMNEISEIVNISDCSIVSFKNITILQTNSPNKLFDSLSAGKPIIVNSAGWTKELLEKSKCGAYVDPERPIQLANLLVDWSKNKDELIKMGQNARLLAENVYDKSILSKKFMLLINNYFLTN